MRDDQSDSDKTKSVAILTQGMLVGHYRIVEKIGAGGMGEVYLAEDTELNRKVALKFLSPHLYQDADCRARFKREAQAAAKLNHPNIVTIHEVSEFNGRPFFAMEHVEGQSLRELIKAKELPIERVIELAIQICEGLHKAHQSGIVHRDVKPANILIDADGRAKILDFGLAFVAGTDHLTKAGSTLGTVGYMSPEQVRGEIVDHRADIFSLGVVLYELITERQPFKGDNDIATLRNITDQEPEPLERYKAGVPDGLQGILAKALAKDKNLRYQHVDDLLVDLKGVCRQPTLQILTKQPSIAVLPFANLSSDLEQEYFCDGMAEEIINALSQLENLRVIARTSAFSFKGKNEDVREIGRKLGVETLLEGSVRKAGNHLRVTAQLIAAKDGSHLWSDRYDKEMKDVFAIQDEISLAIVDRLRIKLLGDEKDDLVRSRARNVEAYNLYLQGRYCWNKRMPKEFKRAIKYFDLAIEKDATYALAYAGLASTYVVLPQFVALPSKEIVPKAEAAARRALQLDPTLAEPHAVLGLIKINNEWNWAGAESEFRLAIELDPNYPTAHHWYKELLLYLGRLDEALAEIKQAQELDPLSLIINVNVGDVLYNMRQYDTATDQFKQVLELDPDFMFAHYALGNVYEVQGEFDKAIVEYQEARKLVGSSSLVLSDLGRAYARTGRRSDAVRILDGLFESLRRGDPVSFDIAQIYFGLGDKDKTFEWLEKAYLKRSFGLLYLKMQPLWDGLRSDPRFTALLKKMGLEP